MKIEDLADMIEEKGFKAFVIHTRGGRDHPVTTPANVWIPGAYPTMACVAVTGRGIALLDIASIEGIPLESEAPVSFPRG